jgi:pimeloyl-ACP methyl ester carboxylesterase
LFPVGENKVESLYVSETGVPGAPGIVFLHGIGTSGWMWNRQTAALPDFHCLTPDLPGHGKSSAVEWVSLADTADQIAAIIRARAANGRAHVVGLSLGGYIALVLMQRHPDVVERAVVSGVTAAPMPNRAWLQPQLGVMSFLMKRRWFANMQAKQMPLSPDEQRAFTENLLAMSMLAYRRIYEEVVDFQVTPAFRQVQTPTLVVAGSKESPIILQSVETIPHIMPNAEGRLAPGVGHGWNVEATSLFNAMTRAWLTGAPLPQELQLVSSRDAETLA